MSLFECGVEFTALYDASVGKWPNNGKRNRTREFILCNEPRRRKRSQARVFLQCATPVQCHHCSRLRSSSHSATTPLRSDILFSPPALLSDAPPLFPLHTNTLHILLSLDPFSCRTHYVILRFCFSPADTVEYAAISALSKQKT